MLTRCSIHKLYPTLCNPMDCSRQALLSRVFFRQEFWSGLPFPPPRDLPNPGTEPASPLSAVLRADSLPAEPHCFSLNLMFILEPDQTPVRIKAENLESSAGS